MFARAQTPSPARLQFDRGDATDDGVAKVQPWGRGLDVLYTVTHEVLMSGFLLVALAPFLPPKDSAAVCAAPAPPSPAVAQPPRAAAASMMDVRQVMMGTTLIIIDVETTAAGNRTTPTTAIINSNNDNSRNGNHLNTTRQLQGLGSSNGFHLWHRCECVRYHQQSS
ncbi:hypothetical protein Vretifemale_21068 [Volvox reticuliferus]|uniref:Uncharacterized protein n=1 Tax=Volvox reticuliferus TaxID=1737510 RepID=A0A8J4D136_9CHLO|nr:hypothetical protein Vretifemale_21068 [Volvox reticuliferus]